MPCSCDIMRTKEGAVMNHDEILRYCLSKPGAFYVVSLDGTVSGLDIIRVIDHACQAVVSGMRGIARR